MSKEKRRVIRYYLQIGTIMWGDNMSRITSYGKQSITDLLGKMNQAENAIDQADKTEDGKSTKKDKSKVFAGDLNLIDDPVTKKRKEAQQKALKVVKDAWDIDRSIDADIQERRDHYDKMKTLYSEAQDEVLKINDQKKALREQHMVEPDSQEQKDLELLEKRQVCMSGKFNIELTEEEWKRCEEIDKAGLTNYQEQAFPGGTQGSPKGYEGGCSQDQGNPFGTFEVRSYGRSREKCRSDHGKCEQRNYRSVETGSHRQHG